MRLTLFFILLFIWACSNESASTQPSMSDQLDTKLVAILDQISFDEHQPLRVRDSMGRKFGWESKEFQKYQDIGHKNHDINEKKIIEILKKRGWPSEAVVGAQGSMIICNVLQHSGLEIRLKYLPMMKEAVKNKALSPRWLARAEDRIATDYGDLQIYGEQIKYYPETKTFDVWPIVDPKNVDKRRAEIGLASIEETLNSRRTPMEWNLEEQIKRTAEFINSKDSQ